MQPVKPVHKPRVALQLLALISIAALLGACNLPLSLLGAGGQGPADQGGQQISPPDQQAPADQAGDSDSGSQEGGVDTYEGIPPNAIACPQGPRQAFLFISHTFDWAPNRDKSVAEIQGQTEASSPCPFTINGNKITAAPCLVPYNNSGVIHGSDGDCQVQGQGNAEITIEGSCSGGELTLTITEFPADETPNATMSCPTKVTPYLTYYPPSMTTRTIMLQVGGGEDLVEDANPDMTNQFSYHKTWALSVEGLLNPPLPEQ
jgi:hypothetical protein